MTPKEEQAIIFVQKLRNEYSKGARVVDLIFKLGDGFAHSRLECQRNATEADEAACNSIADNLEAGGTPVAILVSTFGAPFPQLEIFPEFEKDSEFCHKLKQYADSL